MSALTRTGLTFAATAALVVPIVTGVTAGTAMAHASCTSARPGDHDGGSWNATGSDSRMRSGSSTGCGINSTARPGDRLDYHCYTLGSDGFTWTYVRNDTRSPDTYGWVRDDVLSDGGSFAPCPEF